MEMNRFDIYKELLTKSRTAFAKEHNIEFNDLKKVIEEHQIPIPSAKYLYNYKKGIIAPIDSIYGEDYLIKIDEKLSDKEKIKNKWLYFDDDKKEEIYIAYTNLVIPDKVKRHHKIITKHKEYLVAERKRRREAELDPWSYYRKEAKKVLNSTNISKEALPNFYNLCDTLFKAIESLGFKINVDEEYINISIPRFEKVLDRDERFYEINKDFRIKLKFKEKTKRVKSNDDRYSTYDYIKTGYFKCELTGVYSWSDNYGITKNYPGSDTDDVLLKKIFKRIFELPSILYDEEIEYIERENEKERQRLEAESLREKRKKEFNKIKSLVREYKLHKELEELTEYIKNYRTKNESVEELVWYKETLMWLRNFDKVDKDIDERNHKNILKYLLSEKREDEVEFHDSSQYSWW